MRKIVLLLAILFPLEFIAQGTSATATNIVPVAYFDATPGVPVLSNYNLIASSAQTFPSCAGSQNVYWLKFNIPVPTLTTNSTRSVKVTVNTALFTPTIDFFDGSVTWKECVTGSILRTTPTTNPVIPGQDYYIRISGTDGIAGEAFSVGVEFYPTSEIQTGYYPAPDADGYNLCQQIRRSLVATSGAPLVTATRIRLVPTTSPNNGECTLTITGTTTIGNTTNFPCLCYGTSYDGFVELQVDGHWCGESISRPIVMQSGPTTAVVTATNSTIPFTGTLDCAFACSSANFVWEFLAANGTAIYVTPTPASSTTLQLSTSLGLRFNRIYQVRVRASTVGACPATGPWCGVGGPNTAPMILYTEPMPTVTIPPQYCNVVLPGSTYVDIDFYPGVEQYLFQFVKVNSTSPYAPIAVPKLVNTGASSGVYLFQGQGNVSGSTFRLCCKPLVVSNNNPQQGSWGPYCFYSIFPAAAPSAGMIAPSSPIEDSFYNSTDIITNDQINDGNVSYNETQQILSIDLGDQEIANTGYFQLFDIQGKLIYQDVLINSTGVNMIQRYLPSTLTSGVYIYKVFSDNGAINGKFAVAAN